MLTPLLPILLDNLCRFLCGRFEPSFFPGPEIIENVFDRTGRTDVDIGRFGTGGIEDRHHLVRMGELIQFNPRAAR